MTLREDLKLLCLKKIVEENLLGIVACVDSMTKEIDVYAVSTYYVSLKDRVKVHEDANIEDVLNDLKKLYHNLKVVRV